MSESCHFGIAFIVLVINCGLRFTSQTSVISPTSTESVLSTSSVILTANKGDRNASNQTSTNDNVNKTDHDVNTESAQIQSSDSACPDNTACSILGASCIRCSYTDSCIYGRETEVNCTALASIKCTGSRTFTMKFNCRYCYQTEKKDHVCYNRTDCRVISSPLTKYITNCTVKESVLCLGNRTFYKMSDCNWTSGYRWSTAVLLSLTLGGFGVDRFYLGHWKEGLGKLFSFGGLGVWTLVDLILISIGYVGPADGSLYIF